MKAKTNWYRLLSMMLCFVLCLSLMPTAAFAAGETEITELTATVTAPEAGELPTKTVTTSGNGYTVTLDDWFYSDSFGTDYYSLRTHKLEDTDVFRASCVYFAEVRFILSEGNTVSEDASITINGISPTHRFINSSSNEIDAYVGFTVNASSPAISALSATITAPKAGESPAYTAVSAAPDDYTVAVETWWHGGTAGDTTTGTEMKSGDTFVEGDTYVVQMEFTPDANKVFSSDVAAKINGEDTWRSATNVKTGAKYFRVAFTAAASENGIEISFDANGGTGSMAKMNSDDGDFYYPLCEFTPPAGKVFDYWTYYSGSGEDTDPHYPGEEDRVDGNITLKAHWKPFWTVSFDANGGTGTMAPQTIEAKTQSTYGEFTAPACEFTAPAGKTFDHWEFWAGEIKLEYYVGDDYFAFDSDTTMKAIWKDQTLTGFTVTFEANGGTCGTTTMTTDASGKLASLPTATRTNLEFVGWFKPKTGSKITTDTVFTEDTTVYAMWKISNATFSMTKPEAGKKVSECKDFSFTSPAFAKDTDWTFIFDYPEWYEKGNDTPLPMMSYLRQEKPMFSIPAASG